MEMNINRDEINNSLIELKGISFVYYLMDGEIVVYVGNSANIYKRLKEHKYQRQFDSVKLISFDIPRNAKRFERYEIFRLKPIHNTFAKDKFIEPQIQIEKGKNIIPFSDKVKLINALGRN